MDLRNQQIKETYGNLATINTVAGTPTTGVLQNGAGSNVTTLTIAGTLDATNVDATNLTGTLTGNVVATNLTGTLQTAAQTNITSVGTLTGLAVSGDANFDSGTLFVDVSTDRVGIGTTSPTNKLHLVGSANSTAVLIDAPLFSAGNYVDIELSNTLIRSTKTVGAGTWAESSLSFFTYPPFPASTLTERLRITSSGNVGIGTTSPSSKLHVAGSVLLSGNAPVLRMTDTGSTASFAWQPTGNDLRLYDYNANAQKLRILSSGGITFGTDTAAANALDDYDTGTYTATLTCGTSGTITLNSSFDQLSYTKIGRLMTITGRISVSSVSSPVGNIQLNLPTAIANLTDTAGNNGGMFPVFGTSANVNDFFWFGAEGDSYVIIRKGGSTNGTNDSAETFSGDESMNVSFSYISA